MILEPLPEFKVRVFAQCHHCSNEELPIDQIERDPYFPACCMYCKCRIYEEDAIIEQNQQAARAEL